MTCSGPQQMAEVQTWDLWNQSPTFYHCASLQLVQDFTGPILSFVPRCPVGRKGRVPLPEWTGMDIITGMDYRNGHYTMALGA